MRLSNKYSDSDSFLFYSNNNEFIYQNSSKVDVCNFDLSKLTDLMLTKKERLSTNKLVQNLFNKSLPELTDSDKSILAQYTGFGGIDKSKYGSLSQFYTDYSTVRAIYKSINNSGFKFKNALEPAAGAGAFIGNMANKKWTSIELDHLNYQVLNKLYPKSVNYNISFEEFTKPGFDLIISNVPFLESRGLKTNKIRPDVKALHDFYFLHALDLLNDNGLLVFITSIYTMDSISKNKIREEIISKSDILNAFRLPVKHFAKTAHTDTSADIIILQKRPNGVIIDERQNRKNNSFINTYNFSDNVISNEFYNLYPENFLGDHEVLKNRFGKEFLAATGRTNLSKIKFDLLREYNPKKSINIDSENLIPADSKEFEKWEENNKSYLVKKNITIPTENSSYNNVDDCFFDSFITITSNENFKYYSLYKEIEFKDIIGKARIYNVVDPKQSKQIEILHRILNIADIYQKNGDRYYSELAENLLVSYKNTYSLPAADKKLKSFFKKFDALSFYFDLTTLFDSEFNLSDVFYKKVKYENSGIHIITIDSTLTEKALASENNKGVITINKDSKYLSFKDVKKLISTGYSIISLLQNETIIQNDILYYSGRIYEKIEQGESQLNNKYYSSKIKEQINSLKSILPEFKTVDNFNFKGVECWIRPHLSKWFDIKQRESKRTSQNEWFIIFNDYSCLTWDQKDLYQKYINGRSLVRREEKEAAVLYLQRVTEAEEMIIEIKEKIKQLILNDTEICNKVEYEYNKKYRSYVQPDYLKAKYLINDILEELKKSKLVNPKTGKIIQLRDNQISWIIQAYYEGKCINANDVGAGKTICSIVLARLLKRRGLINKPIFTVPAKTIKKWEFEINLLYPDSNIVNLGNLPQNKRKELLLKTAKTNCDYILISHEGFKQIELDSFSELTYFDHVVSEHIDNENSDSRTQLLIDEKVNDYREILVNRPRDKHITLDNLGIDCIFADEAHNFKNIAVRQELVKSGLGIQFDFNNNTVDKVSLKSARSYDFRFKCNYISDRNNGKNIFLLTATPTPNKPLEVYTMLRHLDKDIFKEYGIYSDLDFSNSFFEFGVVKDIKNRELTKSVLSKIINAVELKNILNRFIDKKSIENLNIEIPAENIINHYLEKSNEYSLIEQDLRDRQSSLNKSREAGEDTPIAIYTNARNASIDPRLYFGAHASIDISERSYDSKDDKIELALNIIADKIINNPECGQLIFLDTAGYSKFEAGLMDEDIHKEIKRELLLRTGVNKNEIAIMTGRYITNLKTGNDIKTPSGNKKDVLKFELQDKFNSGEVKIIIGSTLSMGEGMDLQMTTSDIYHLDIPYNSAAIRQRNGRGIRYGNMNSTVNVHNFFMKGSFDSISYDLVSKKKGWNEALWNKEVAEEISTKEEMQGGSMPSTEQILIELEADPEVKEMMKLEYKYKLMNEEREAVYISLHRAKSNLSYKQRFLNSLLETKERKKQIIQDINNKIINSNDPVKSIEYQSKQIETLDFKIDLTLKQIESLKSKIRNIKITYNNIKKEIITYREKYLLIDDEAKAA